MSTNPHRSDAAANAATNAMASLCDGGFLRIYDSTGTGQPANANTPVTTQVLLAELRLNIPAFGLAVAGVATANSISDDPSANATGTATWFRILGSDGVSVVWDDTCDIAAAAIVLSTTAIVAGNVVAVSSLTLTNTE